MHLRRAKSRFLSIVCLTSTCFTLVPIRRAIAESDVLDAAVEENQTLKALHRKFRRRTALHGVNLTWSPSPSSPNIDGYRVYYGTNPGRYAEHIDVGLETSIKLPKPANDTYFYVVVAYKGSVESAPSNEVESSKAVPFVNNNSGEPPTTAATPASSPVSHPSEPSVTSRGPGATAAETNQTVSADNTAAAATPTLRFQRRLERLHMAPRGSSAPGATGPEVAPK